MTLNTEQSNLKGGLVVKTILFLILLIVLVANFPKQSMTFGNKVVNTFVSFASGSYEIGKITVKEIRTQVEKIEKVSDK